VKAYVIDFVPNLLRLFSLCVGKVVELEILLSESVVRFTENLMDRLRVRNLLSVICLCGPIIFLPNVWSAWTADDISSMNNPSWAVMIIVHLSVYIRLSHDKASPCTRISILIWMFEMILITLAILVR